MSNPYLDIRQQARAIREARQNQPITPEALEEAVLHAIKKDMAPPAPLSSDVQNYSVMGDHVWTSQLRRDREAHEINASGNDYKGRV